jgi:hypothetical protein
MSLIIQIGFGLVVIAMAFLVFVFWRAFDDDSKRFDARYRLVAMSLLIGSVGVGMWAFNPLLQSFGYESLPLPGMAVASTLILLSASLLIGSTAIGSTKRTLKAFLISCAVWIAACVTMALL